MSRMNDTDRQAVTARIPGSSSARKKVLIVDDEKDIVDLLAYNLGRNGYDTLIANDGNTALELTAKNLPDLIILDLMLPGIDGTEVARRLKADARTANIPIVMLTAKGEETDVVVGLTLGADDYVTKPFSMKVLLARVGSVLRRAEAGAARPVRAASSAPVPSASIPSSTSALVEEEAIKLTLTEFKLLSALLTVRGRVLTRDQLMDKAMGTDVFVTDRAIDVHITAIRKKLGTASWLVNTVRGVGYRLRESPEDND